MGVSLIHATAGTLAMPSPALGQPVTTIPNQAILRTPGGAVHTFRHGPAYWQIARTFEFLTEVETKAFWDWWELLGRSGVQFTYQYKDPADGTLRTPFARIIGPPRESKLAHNMRNITLVMEHTQHPDSETDKSVQV